MPFAKAGLVNADLTLPGPLPIVTMPPLPTRSGMVASDVGKQRRDRKGNGTRSNSGASNIGNGKRQGSVSGASNGGKRQRRIGREQRQGKQRRQQQRRIEKVSAQ